jgi:uncharacterized membrane protein (DUF2068 family)
MSDHGEAESSAVSRSESGAMEPPTVSSARGDGAASSALSGAGNGGGNSPAPAVGADGSAPSAGTTAGGGGGKGPHPKLDLPPRPPGSVPRRRLHPRIDYDLIGCGLHGHVLVGTNAAKVRIEDAPFVRELDGKRWQRCLRCDAWVVLDPPGDPQEEYPPGPDEVQMPLKGRRLRDRYVLRLIVLDRIVHSVALGLLAVAIFLFAQHRSFLHHEYTKVLAALQGGVGGPVGSAHSGIVRDLNRLFALSTTKLYLVGVVVAAYTAMLVAEAVGLWRARRWAEYLTFFETGLLVPFEIYELSSSVTALKVLTLVINLAIVLYLLVAHRLFGIRGGRAAALADYGAEG